MQTLSYPIAIRCEKNKQIINTLFFFRKVINFYIRQFFDSSSLSLLGKNKYAYKCLEKASVQKRFFVPSRINRGLLEIVGRILRGLKDRRELYSLLKRRSAFPGDWDFNLLSERKIFRKSQYIENISMQALNYLEENDSLPEDYLNLVSPPELKNGMISFAPDDGQAIKLEKKENDIKIKLKVLKEDRNFSLSSKDWEWIELTCVLPDIVKESQFSYKKPCLRVSNISGKLTPILDLKVEQEKPTESNSSKADRSALSSSSKADRSALSSSSKADRSALSSNDELGRNFLTVDWGLNKLVTVCVFSLSGEQISRPFFLKCDKIQNKLLRIRKEIDSFSSKRDNLPSCSTKANWYNREIAKRWHKFRQIQKQLSHLASNVIVEIANFYNCCKIYVEWLGSLRSQKKSRTLNWKINSQVRQQIYEKVEYKAKMAGISLERPINPAWTSQFCPKCGKRGVNVKASDRLDERKKSGGWFYCKNCGYNADRDYVATQNIARKVLWGKKLKNQSKAFAYKTKAISDKLFRQSIDALSRLRDNLNGWKDVVFLRPVYLVAGTLRL